MTDSLQETLTQVHATLDASLGLPYEFYVTANFYDHSMEQHYEILFPADKNYGGEMLLNDDGHIRFNQTTSLLIRINEQQNFWTRKGTYLQIDFSSTTYDHKVMSISLLTTTIKRRWFNSFDFTSEEIVNHNELRNETEIIKLIKLQITRYTQKKQLDAIDKLTAATETKRNKAVETLRNAK